jgi:hypothetical protein
MLRDWFGTRTLRSPERVRFFRPRLEYLEGRLAPSSMGMQGNDNNGGDDQGGGDDRNGEPPGQERQINQYDGYNTSNNSLFSQVIDNLTVNQFFTYAGMSQTQLQQTFLTDLTQSAQVNVSQTIALVTDEVHLAADTSLAVSALLSGSASGSNAQALVQDMTKLQIAIQTNPLEATAAGQTLGMVSFNLALQATLSSQVNNGSNMGHS